MGSEPRLKRLRELIEQLERLPATAERDRMLREVRARVVDVDTGVTPESLRTLDPDALPGRERRPPAPRQPAIPQEPRSQPQATPRPAAAEPARPVQPRAESADDLLALAADDLLSLADPPYSPAEDTGKLAVAPWARGLRG